MSSGARIEPLGEAALLVRFSDRLDDAANRDCVAFRAELEADPIPGVVETASSLGSVLVRFAGEAGAVEAALAERLCRQDRQPGTAKAPARHWRVPCAFGGDAGPQLGEVARHAGMGEDEAIRALSKTSVRVLALGFAPGMPYMGILPDRWDVPRQSGLTPRVPEGALVLAVRQLIIFGTEAPTGWRQVGMTRFGCFRPERAVPIALSPGDQVRFDPVSPAELEDRAAADLDGYGGATWDLPS